MKKERKEKKEHPAMLWEQGMEKEHHSWCPHTLCNVSYYMLTTASWVTYLCMVAFEWHGNI